jgi:hypothetical protein
MDHPPSPGRAGDVRWGVRAGLWFTAVYGVVAFLIFAFGGALALPGAWLRLGGVLAAYLVAGVAAGAVVGAMRGRLGSYLGVCAASIAAGVPAWCAIGTAAIGKLPYAWDDAEWFSYGLCVLVVGPIMGCSLRRVLR